MTLNVLTASEAAEALRISLDTVYRLIDQGKIPASKVGRQYRIREQDLEELMAPPEPQPTTPRNQRQRIAELLRKTA